MTRLTLIGILDAGMAGLSAATVLSDAGFSVRVFDKGRSPGGRVSTRRVKIAEPGGGETELLFDHGAQFVRASSPSLSHWLKEQTQSGHARNWVIGGERVFSDALMYTDRIELTHVDTEITDGDAFYPELPNEFAIAEQSEQMHDEKSALDFKFVTYRRKSAE